MRATCATGQVTRRLGPRTQDCQLRGPRAVFDGIQKEGPREPDHTELDDRRRRIIRRSLWVTEVAGLDSPHAAHVTRTRHDGYDRDCQLISKEIVHAVNSLSPAATAPLA